MKRLYRSEKNRKIAGVIGGLAEYLNMDASLLRIIAVVLTLLTSGLVPLVYIIWCFVVPLEGDLK
ncbi:PspC domain-containing protein [Bacillus sp. ISL-51]|uniref:PspC domain-containing protein n=1 Tax=Bacteria TaxID=2 RepID=UPI001BE810A5|nr:MULTISPECIES: PspC domain-containing protein [Bacteria]MBT2572837.1 PspC domain-containing protein [Bacillus sp. ISL-51]MBT2635438.1 PspC domain-containing protein [Bacillus sp. ISL-26]MBT2713310.1 PspC domain-containing protein [Pseudomonas sp. ISL-88]MBY8911534.1 PspC domain-containing protein [Bacillus sp. YC2]